MRIKVLGAYGGRCRDLGTTCFQLSEGVILDAGNVMRALGEECMKIDHVFLTHAHLDHIVDIPFMIDYTFRFRERPLNIYGHRETLEALKDYIMNWNIWPEFSSIRLINSGDYAVNYVEIEPYEEIELNGLRIKTFPSNHTITTLSYVVKRGDRGVLITGDTYKNPKVWETINEDEEIKALITEVSYPSYMHNLAEVSKHHTPKTLREELDHLEREVDVYVMHLKPNAIEELRKEIREVLPQVKVLEDGDEIII